MTHRRPRPRATDSSGQTGAAGDFTTTRERGEVTPNLDCGQPVPATIAAHFPAADLVPPKRLKLADGRYVLLDGDWHAFLSSVRWHASGTDGNYAARKRVNPDGSHGTEYLHRIVADAPPGVPIDHKNGNTLDCRRANLRLATPSLNAVNAGRPNRTGYIGIAEGAPGRFRAVCQKGGRVHRGQYRDSPEQAARDRDDIMRTLWGSDWPCFNYPRPGERGIERPEAGAVRR